MPHQIGFTNHEKCLTGREAFLSETEKIVLWLKLITLIESAYLTPGRGGRQPMP
jgi:hypothetical protein